MFSPRIGLCFFLFLSLLLSALAQTGNQLIEQARAAEQSGQTVLAREMWGKAAHAFSGEGNPAGQALCLFYRAILEYQSQENQSALLSLDQAERLFTELKRDDGVALVLLQRGAILSASNRLPEAEEAYRTSLEAARRQADPERIGEALRGLAETLDAQQRWNEAYDAYRRLMDHQVARKQSLEVADTLTTLGAIKQVQTRPEEALEHYQSALRMFLDGESFAQAAEVTDRISRLLLSRHDWVGAQENLTRAIEFHTTHNEQERVAIARANLGYALENQNRFQEAAEQYRRSAGLFSELGDEKQVRQVRRQLVKSLALAGDRAAAQAELDTLYGEDALHAGKLCLELGWSKEAEDYFQIALDNTSERLERARLLNQLGMLATRRAELSKAKDFLTQSLQLARESEDQKLAASVLNNLGENLQSSGSYSEAEPCYLQALQHFQQTGDLSGQAYALSNLGTLKFARGDYAKALQYLDQAHALARNPETFGGPHALLGTILNALGLVHQFLGRSDEAERLYMQAVAARRSVHDMHGELVTWNNLAAMFSENRAPKTAEKNFRVALELSERLNEPSHQGHLHNNLGLVLVAQGREQEAREHYEKALSLYRAQGLKDGEAITLDNLGHLESDPKKAAAYHIQAIDILKEVGNRQSLATAFLNLGSAQERMGDNKQAIASLTRSVELLDELALSLSPGDKTAFLGKNVAAYQSLVRLLIEEQREEEAFRVNEKARARALLELLGGRTTPVRNAPPELVWREESLRARIRALLSEPMTDGNHQRLSSLKGEYELLLDEIARLDPGSAGLRSQDLPGRKSLSEALGEKRALLEYVVMSDRTYLFLIGRGRLSVFQLELGEKQLYDMLTSWRKSLAGGGDDELARRLGRLVEPALPHLAEVEELVIVPHQNLHYLPFSALQVGETSLIEQFRLTQAPSAGAWLAGQKQKLRKGPLTAAALGTVSPGRDPSAPNRGSNLSPLPGTLEEVNTLASLFPNSRQILEEDLTTEQLEQAGTNSGVLHVATHGILDYQYPLFSGLATSDGLVTVADILEWERTPDLVVLSACETALGELGDGDDMVGLSRAFQAGGTRCLVATLWPVSDESTSLWMGSFYQALKNGETVAEASSSATKLLQQQYPSPFYWAPFVVVGDGRTRIEFDS